jgi:hypothetical protein
MGVESSAGKSGPKRPAQERVGGDAVNRLHMTGLPAGEQRYVLAKERLRAAVVADGGFRGLFSLARMPAAEEDLIRRYDKLLNDAVSPADRERNKRAQGGESPEDINDRNFMEVASIQGLHPDDVSAMMLTMAICSVAFPGVSPDEIPTE